MTFTINTKTLAAGLKPMAKLVKGKITAVDCYGDSTARTVIMPQRM